MIVVLQLGDPEQRPDLGLLVVTKPPDDGWIEIFINGRVWGSFSYDKWLGEITLHSKVPKSVFTIKILDSNGCTLDNYIVRMTSA